MRESREGRAGGEGHRAASPGLSLGQSAGVCTVHREACPPGGGCVACTELRQEGVSSVRLDRKPLELQVVGVRLGEPGRQAKVRMVLEVTGSRWSFRIGRFSEHA